MNGEDSGQKSKDNSLQLKMVIKGKTMEMFEFLKEFYNLGYNAEVIRLLIKRDFDRQQGKQE